MQQELCPTSPLTIMASFVRLAGILRRSPHYLVQCRKFTSTTARRNDATSNLAVQKKPIGGFRGGYIIITIIFLMLISYQISIIGFLFGFSLASSFAAYHLLDEYQRASAALQTSVEELKISTEKVSVGATHCHRILNHLLFRSRHMLGE